MILSKLGGLVKSAGKALGDKILNTGKSAIKSTIGSITDDMVGKRVDVDNVTNKLTNIKSNINDEFNDIPQLQNPPEVIVVNEDKPEPNYIPESPKVPETPDISYKDMNNMIFSSNKIEAIEEFKRHNLEMEDIARDEVELRDKLNRDKFGLDILEFQKSEYHKKLLEDRIAKIDKKNEELRNEAERRKRSLEESIRSEGKLEAEDELNKSESSTEGKDSSESKDKDSDSSILSDIGSAVPGIAATTLLPKLLKSAKNKVVSLGSALKSRVGKLGRSLIGDRGVKVLKFMGNPTALVKLGKKMLSKILPIVPKLASKLGLTMAKTGVKSVLKQIPIVGIALGVGEAISDISKGDYIGAGLAALSGIAPTLNLIVPGLGTAISLGAIGADVARDILTDPIKDAVNVFDQSTPESILKESDTDLSNTINPDYSDYVNYTEPEVPRYESTPSKPQFIPDVTQELTSNPVTLISNAQSRSTPIKYKKELLDRQKVAFDYLTNEGLSPEASSGIIGCLMGESTLIPSTVNVLEKRGKFPGSKANGPGYGAGIAQWSNERKSEVLNYLRNNHKPESGTGDQIEDYGLEAQLGAVVDEIKRRPKLYQDLQNPGLTANDATDLVLRGFENGNSTSYASVPQLNKYTWAGGYMGLMYGKDYGGHDYGRANYAKDALDNYYKSNPNLSKSIIPNSSKIEANIAMPKNISAVNEVSTKVPSVTKSSPEPSTIASNQNPVIINNSPSTPVINGGSTNNVTIINNKVSNDLNSEVFG